MNPHNIFAVKLKKIETERICNIFWLNFFVFDMLM